MLESKTIRLRLACVDDAEFILSLRISEKYNKYLSSVEDDVELQKSWLKEYKNRESIGLEYYFIIERKDNGFPIGTVRLYDFKESENSFSWGSWILNENKTRTAAVESAMLVYQFAFEVKKFSRSHFEVRRENKAVLAFHEKLGAIKTDENDTDIYYHYYPEAYQKQKVSLERYL
nr:GNAT family N-acetyltransferase [Kistimonas asteriae]